MKILGFYEKSIGLEKVFVLEEVSVLLCLGLEKITLVLVSVLHLPEFLRSTTFISF